MTQTETWRTSANMSIVQHARESAALIDLAAAPPDGSGDWFAWAGDDEALYRAYCPDVEDRTREEYAEQVEEEAADFGAAFRDHLRERVAGSIEQKLGITLEPSGGWDDVTDAQLRERLKFQWPGECWDCYCGPGSDCRCWRCVRFVESDDTVAALERRGVLTATEVAWLRDAD